MTEIAAGAAGAAALVAAVADGVGPEGGPVDLVEAVRVLAGVDPVVLDGESRVDLIRGWERVLAMAAAAQQVALAAVAEATAACGLAGLDARHEVGAALRLAPGTAAERTEVALQLSGRLGGTLAALRRGEVSWRQAADLAVAVRELPDDLAAAVQARVLDRMGGRTAAESRRAVQAAIIAVDPAGAAQRGKEAVRARHIERMAQPDAMASWWFAMPAHTERDLWAEVTRRARAYLAARRAAGHAAGHAAGLDDGLDAGHAAGHDDGTGLDALRVDCLIDALLGPGAAQRLNHDLDHDTDTDTDDNNNNDADADDADDGSVDTAAGAAALTGTDDEAVDAARAGAEAVDETVWARLRATGAGAGYVPQCSCGGRQVAAVILDLPTALGLAEHPGVIPGHGTVPAGLARAMAADRDWVRWATDPGTRQVIDRGSETYRPSPQMRAFLAARDRVCGFPGCHRRAQDCDCDHVVNFGLPDGRTVAVNLGPLRRTHHNAKTHGRWQISYDPTTGTKTWTSPLGKTYTKGTDPPLA